MNYGLIQLFALLDESIPVPEKFSARFEAGELFAEDHSEKSPEYTNSALADFAVVAGIYSSDAPELPALPTAACLMYELSTAAFSAFVHAWMSELPIETEAIRFGRKILGTANGDSLNRAAEIAAHDRGDPDVRLILDTAYKVWLEVDRLRGLLRFTPGGQGQYIARCSPDYLVLPALTEHFTTRFGDTPWTIIDEKRGLCLRRPAGQPPAICNLEDQAARPDSDEWEQLWRYYHRTINNENRNNPSLQRRFMPKRYWKNLPEMR
jgi:probable DNA metabolism protein